MTTKMYPGKTLRAFSAAMLFAATAAMAQPPALPALPALPEENPAQATPAAETPAAALPVTPLAATPAAVGTFAPQPGAPGFANPAMPPTAAPSDAMRQQAFEPVRQAIANRDFTAAAQALEQARQQYPTDRAIVTFENAIRNGMAQGTAGAPPLIRTPAAGVTPLPQVQATPRPTPEPTPVPADTTSDEDAGYVAPSGNKLQNLTQEQPAVVYGAAAVLALAVIGGLIYFFKRRKATPPAAPSIYEDETPPPGSLPAVTPDQFDFSPGLGASELPPAAPADFSLSPAADFPAAEFTAFGETGAEPGAGMASPAATEMPEFTSFGLHEEEEQDQDARPAMPQRPAPAPDADAPLNLFGDDEPTVAIPAAPAPAPAEPDSVSLDFSDDTIQLPATPPPAPAKPTTPEYTSGPVNLDDIFGGPTAAPADEDPADHTLPTFVSTPHVENPEDNVELPNQNMRPPAADDSDKTISFDQLFGGGDTTPQPKPAPAPPPQPVSDMSIEDALAATLGAMQEHSPDDAPPPAAEPLDASTSENLDERTERMFADQMTKARAAMDQEDWRQAIHVLSIASALHPENEEAKQMLRQARAERRKAEESV